MYKLIRMVISYWGSEAYTVRWNVLVNEVTCLHRYEVKPQDFNC